MFHSLHFEINSWFRCVQTLHQSTLALKLRILTLRKQLPHWSAMCWPTTKQMSPGLLLAATVAKPLWSEEDWDQWCAELGGRIRGKVLKADLPVHAQRRQEVNRLAAWLKKRPAGSAPVTVRKKRTAFTRVRQDALIRSGIRHAAVPPSAIASVKKRPAGLSAIGVAKRPASGRLLKRPSNAA